MSDDLVKQARASLVGVTLGPFVHDAQMPANVYSDDATGSIVATCKGFKYAPRPEAEQNANARFFAAARQLVPAMADRIEALEALLAAMRDPTGLTVAYLAGAESVKRVNPKDDGA